ncbi:MAG: aminodeoxychorismate/anthranilate synthase component II [Hyphomicrobiaceae bacterium]|nr:aminodeoxychorismate/anthranilate synthase component II [Hyphomicrobiaceae bacterium]
MFLMVDNYDSFTYNLVHFLGELGAELDVRRNDEISVDDVIAMNPEGIILSPGPCTPNEAGICLETIRRCGASIPILGVCLGHQSIGQAYGGVVKRAPYLMHGKTSVIHHTNGGIFRGINADFLGTRYHSLIVERATMPTDLEIVAETDDKLVMGLAHKTHPVHGVQFHPESIASENGHRLLKNFLDIARDWNGTRRARAA